MKFHDAFPSDYFKAADIDGEAPVLMITEVSTEAMRDGEEKRTLSFKETKKRLPLNKTNWMKVSEITGEEDDGKWPGKQIRLVKERVVFRGERVDAVRVDNADAPF